MKERIDRLNEATLNALRNAGETRSRMEKIEKMIKEKISISKEEYEQYLLDCKFFSINKPLTI